MLLALAALALVADGSVDAERSAWRYRRAVTVSGDRSLATLLLPPELSVHAAPYGRDMRLVDATGREIPYLVDWTNAREGLSTFQASVADVRREQETGAEAIRSRWTLDLGASRTFTDLALHVPDTAFAWHVRVEGSGDASEYTLLEADAPLFDQTWNNERVRRTEIRFKSPVTARYLRLTARSASGSPTLDITGASVTLRRRLESDAWSTTLKPSASPVSKGNGVSRYTVDASSLLPFEEVEILCDDTAFARRARLIETTNDGGRTNETVLGAGSIFRVRGNDAIVEGESVRLAVRSGSGGGLYLEIDNGDSPPLRNLRVRLLGSRMRLVFPATPEALTLYYGNDATRAPSYDLESLRPRLTQIIGTAASSLGPEEGNPAFRKEPPLRFPATPGALLDPTLWRQTRNLEPLAEEDVYTLTLGVVDLAALQPDLGDLRIVDVGNRQIPYLIERDFAEERLPLSIERPDPPPHKSLFALSPKTTLPQGGNVSASRIELEVRDAFFERNARLSHEGPSTRRRPGLPVVLARRPPSTDPLIIDALTPMNGMSLEVEDGDNAALDISAATAIVRVPRVVFKSSPGRLRLLLGNPQVAAPRYDISGLRSELLAWSAIVARAGELSTNEGTGVDLWSRAWNTPRGALVWGAMISAIAVLVALTLRTLKRGV